MKSIGHWGKRITDGIILAAISKYVLNRLDLLKEIFNLKEELVLSTILGIKKKTILKILDLTKYKKATLRYFL